MEHERRKRNKPKGGMEDANARSRKEARDAEKRGMAFSIYQNQRRAVNAGTVQGTGECSALRSRHTVAAWRCFVCVHCVVVVWRVRQCDLAVVGANVQLRVCFCL